MVLIPMQHDHTKRSNRLAAGGPLPILGQPSDVRCRFDEAGKTKHISQIHDDVNASIKKYGGQ